MSKITSRYSPRAWPPSTRAAPGANFDRVARVTGWLTVLIFCISTLLAIAVAVQLTRRLTAGISLLKSGAESIGSGNLEQLIPLHGRDELTDLAIAFNQMTTN